MERFNSIPAPELMAMGFPPYDSFWQWATERYRDNVDEDGRHIWKDNRYGDLAQDMYFDSEFPKDSDDGRKIAEYLESCGACDRAMRVFTDAWKMYKRYVRNMVADNKPTRKRGSRSGGIEGGGVYG